MRVRKGQNANCPCPFLSGDITFPEAHYVIPFFSLFPRTQLGFLAAEESGQVSVFSWVLEWTWGEELALSALGGRSSWYRDILGLQNVWGPRPSCLETSRSGVCSTSGVGTFVGEVLFWFPGDMAQVLTTMGWGWRSLPLPCAPRFLHWKESGQGWAQRPRAASETQCSPLPLSPHSPRLSGKPSSGGSGTGRWLRSIHLSPMPRLLSQSRCLSLGKVDGLLPGLLTSAPSNSLSRQ